MLFESSLPAGFLRKAYGEYVFYEPPSIDLIVSCIGALNSGAGDCLPVSAVEEHRAVYILQSRQSILKYNRLRSWKLRLLKGVGVGWGRKNCLVDEFRNLARLAGSELVPRTHGYGCRRVWGFLLEEYLLVELFDGASTLDEALMRRGAADLLPKVFELFDGMLREGFCHLDPHPGNILVMPGSELKLIDFEGCSFDVSDRSFCMGFCLGRFYNFWFGRYMAEADYDRAVYDFFGDADEVFRAVYERFKTKVSRKVVHRCFSEPSMRAAFIDACLQR